MWAEEYGTTRGCMLPYIPAMSQFAITMRKSSQPGLASLMAQEGHGFALQDIITTQTITIWIGIDWDNSYDIVSIIGKYLLESPFNIHKLVSRSPYYP